MGTSSLRQKAGASINVDNVDIDETLQASSALYRSGRARKRLANGILAGTLLPLLVAFSLTFLCRRIYSTASVSGMQQRRLAEGKQEEAGLSDNELRGILQECIEAAQRISFPELSGEPPDVGWPAPDEGQANVYGEKLASSQELQQPPAAEKSASAIPEALVDKGAYADIDPSSSIKGIWTLTDDDLLLGEQELGTGFHEGADTERQMIALTTEDELSSGYEPPPRSAEKHKLHFKDFSDDEDQIIRGEDFWWGQNGNTGGAKRQMRQRKRAASPPSTTQNSFSEDFPTTTGSLKDHPWIRLPKVPPAMVRRRLRFDLEELNCLWQGKTPLRLLKDIRVLLLKPQLSFYEVELLMLTAEALCYKERGTSNGWDPGSRPSHILEKVASIFMVFDALLCTMHVLGQTKELEDEWKKFTSSQKIHYDFPERTVHGHYENAKVQQNIRWARRVSAALEVYERGDRPPDREVFAIKKMIFTNPSIRRFAGLPGQDWRDDLQMSSSNKPGGATGGSSGGSSIKQVVKSKPQ
ncbi:hypothetical protein Emag_001559 [Eimeria magna]